jgi:prepilin-type N-terminal cleavage/methylation domain-containing protein
MKKAFSLVELLVTLVLIAVLSGVAISVYKNISKSAQLTAQNQDQQALQQIIESFHTTGGNLSTINTQVADPYERAAALTLLFQSPSSSITRPKQVWVARNDNHPLIWKSMGDSSLRDIEQPYRTAKGTVFGGLSSNKKIIPYPNPVPSPNPYPTITDETNPAISVFYFDSNNQLKLGTHIQNRTYSDGVTSCPEYIVVDATSQLYQDAVASHPSAGVYAVRNATAAVQSVSMAGSKYATHTAYIWDEDPNPVAGPGVKPVIPNMPNALLQDITFSGDNPSSLSFGNYTNISDPDSVTIFVYRADGQPVTAGTAFTAQLGGGASFSGAAGSQSEVISGTLKAVQGIILTKPLYNLLDVTSWANNSYTLAINVTAGNGEIAPAVNNPTLTISPTALTGVINSPNPLNHGGTFTIDASGNPVDQTHGNVPVCTITNVNLGGLPSGTSSGQVSQSLDATGTVDTCTYH